MRVNLLAPSFVWLKGTICCSCIFTSYLLRQNHFSKTKHIYPNMDLPLLYAVQPVPHNIVIKDLVQTSHADSVFNSFTLSVVVTDIEKMERLNCTHSTSIWIMHQISKTWNLPDEDELIKIIKIINNKSAGEDNIPPNIVKACQNQLLKPLLILINRSLNEGIFPDNLKIAKVIPIYKKNEEYTPGNYRSISLLTCCSKLFEKIMYTRLYSFLNQLECCISTKR